MLDKQGRDLRLYWFPWCTASYVDSFVKEKKAELIASGEYFGVRSYGGVIKVQLAVNPDTGYSVDRKECIELGLLDP